MNGKTEVKTTMNTTTKTILLGMLLMLPVSVQPVNVSFTPTADATFNIANIAKLKLATDGGIKFSFNNNYAQAAIGATALALILASLAYRYKGTNPKIKSILPKIGFGFLIGA